MKTVTNVLQHVLQNADLDGFWSLRSSVNLLARRRESAGTNWVSSAPVLAPDSGVTRAAAAAWPEPEPFLTLLGSVTGGSHQQLKLCRCRIYCIIWIIGYCKILPRKDQRHNSFILLCVCRIGILKIHLYIMYQFSISNYNFQIKMCFLTPRFFIKSSHLECENVAEIGNSNLPISSCE